MLRSAGAPSAALLLAALLTASLTGAVATPVPVASKASGDGASAQSAAAPAADMAAPVVDGLTVSPSTVDVSNGPAHVTLRVHVTDDTGTQPPLFSVHHSITDASIETLDADAALVSGTVRDGVWEQVIVMPTAVPNGTWNVLVSAYTDVLGNRDGDQRDAVTTFTVSGGTVTDVAAPVVGSVTATPSTLDLSSGAREITVRARITDETGSEVPYVTARARDYLVSVDLVDMELSSGTVQDGWWTGTITLPAAAPNGTWILEVVAPRDLSGNSMGEHNTTAVTAEVVGSSRTDYSAPVVQDASVSPAAWDLMNGHGRITVTADISDATGTQDATVYSSSEADGTEIPFSFHTSLHLVSGTAKDGTWRGQFTIPEGAPVGNYTIDLLTKDHLGNGDITNLDPVVVSYGDAPAVPLRDVGLDDWFYTPVAWLVEREITTGYQDGTFRPASPVTRGEAVAFLYRYADPAAFEVPNEPSLDDVPVDHTFFEPISWATENGVVHGYQDGTFRPGKKMTRAEVAAVLYRQAEPEHTAPAKSPFTDVTPESSQYEAITWLNQRRITTGRGDGTFAPDADVTRAEIAAFLQRYDTVLTP